MMTNPEPEVMEKGVEEDLRWQARMMGEQPSTAWRRGTQKLLIRAAEEIERLRSLIASRSPEESQR